MSSSHTLTFDDIPLLAFAQRAYYDELENREERELQIYDCIVKIRLLGTRVPITAVRRLSYWRALLSKMSLLVELMFEALVGAWIFAWAEAYLRVRRVFQYV